MRIAVFANTSWYIYNFRMNLIRRLRQEGHDVIAIGSKDAYVEKIKSVGVEHVHISLAGSRINPFVELLTILELRRILRSNNIELVLSFTPKANIYSSFVSSLLRIGCFANVSGLGRVFIKKTLLTSLVKRLYRFSFVNSDRVFFQNKEDRQYFESEKLVGPEKSVLLPGSGVDLERFKPSGKLAPKEGGHPFVFLLIARIIWDKGIAEYVEAARKIRIEFTDARFQLLGSLDSDNPSSIPRSKVNQWIEEGIIEYLGSTDDVRKYLNGADCVVLPSFYREGTPRSLLEAASMGKPIITTDSVGCRDTVDDGETGFLCEAKNSEDLKDKMRQMIELTEEERVRLGRRGRNKMEKEFSEKLVIDAYLCEISEYTKSLHKL